MLHGACRDGFARGFCAFVLGDHALHLQQQIFFGAVADGSIQEDQVDTAPPQLLDKQNLVGVLPGQAIGGMHVQAIEGARVRRVAQSLQRGTRQRCPAVALVDESEFFRKRTAVGDNALLERSSWLPIVFSFACCSEETRA